MPTRNPDHMPYIPPHNRPPIDAKVAVLADAIVTRLLGRGETAEMSVHYRAAFRDIAAYIAAAEAGRASAPADPAQALAAAILAAAAGYRQRGAWAGELNYALTMLIQKVPYLAYERGEWSEPLRYWIYAQTVGALTRAAYEVHATAPDDYVGNALAGVFEDVKDEYKRRVNTAYEAAQITKSGDCYDLVPYRTELTPFEHGGVAGFIEIQLPYRDPKTKGQP